MLWINHIKSRQWHHYIVDSVVINISFFDMNSCGYRQDRKMKSYPYGYL